MLRFTRRTLLLVFVSVVLLWSLVHFQDVLLLHKARPGSSHLSTSRLDYADTAYHQNVAQGKNLLRSGSAESGGVDADQSRTNSYGDVQVGANYVNLNSGVKPGVKSVDSNAGTKRNATSVNPSFGAKFGPRKSEDSNSGVDKNVDSVKPNSGAILDSKPADPKPGVRTDSNSKDTRPWVDSIPEEKGQTAARLLENTDGSDTKKDASVPGNSFVEQQGRPTELCPEKPPIASNETKVPLNLTEVTYEDLEQKFGHLLQNGGHYAPSTCRSREQVAIIIPYRDRQRNLFILLNNLIPFLIRQQAEFTIFIVEQTKDYLFNRCLMFNVGFVLAQRHGNFSCYITHDTDLIPRDYRNLYRCSDKPRHLVLSRSNEHWEEKLPYKSFIGGALALRKEHMEKCNGCSNYYYGWGLEDDDLEIRLKSRGLLITRYPMEIGGYYSLGHPKQTDNTSRGKLVKTIRTRMKIEGLSTLKYELIMEKRLEIYTAFLVKPPPPPSDVYT